MSPDELLEGLTEPQRQAVTHGDGPLLVLAGPGSGKTRVITHRAAYLALTITRARHILAITFTNKAANEMGARLDRLGVGQGMTCCTFHSLCARLLRIYGQCVGLQSNFTIFDDADQLAVMKKAIERANLSSDNFTPRRLLSLISGAKNNMIGPAEYAEHAHGWQDRKIADAFKAYNQLLAEQNAVDFDDLLVKTAAMLGDQPDIRGQLEDRFRYVLVDEYQDTNRAQYLIARGLALGHENLCVTGDPDQSIYAWRGADVHNILQFEKDFPEAVVVRLEQNYRSTPQILEVADALIRHNKRRKKKKLWTENSAGEPVRVVECEDEREEAAFIAREIRKHVENGGTYGQVAIFYRVNAMSRNLEAALRTLVIPYQIARGVAFYQRKTVKDILAYLKLAVNPRDLVSLERIINVPTRGIGKTSFDRVRVYAQQAGKSLLEVMPEAEKIPGAARAVRGLKSFAQLIADLQTTAAHGSAKDTVEFVLRHSGFIAAWTSTDDEEAEEHADELVNAAAEYDRQHPDGSGSLQDWLQQISLISDVDAVDEQAGSVTLMTLHAAKGLEFDVVHMVGLEHGLLPHERSEIDRADVEEERRLCFVGMTRACKRLTLSCAKWRDHYGISQRRAKSPFLAELPRDQVVRITADADDDDDNAWESDEDEDDLPASALDFIHWRKGQLVRHKDFGVGCVLWIQPRNQRTHAGIKFASLGEKTLILEYANLELLETDPTE